MLRESSADGCGNGTLRGNATGFIVGAHGVLVNAATWEEGKFVGSGWKADLTLQVLFFAKHPRAAQMEQEESKETEGKTG